MSSRRLEPTHSMRIEMRRLTGGGLIHLKASYTSNLRSHTLVDAPSHGERGLLTFSFRRIERQARSYNYTYLKRKKTAVRALSQI